MNRVHAGRSPLVFIFVTRLIDAMGFGIVMPVLPGLLVSMGAKDLAQAAATAGILLVTYAALQFFFGPLIGNLSDRFGRRPVILTSLFAYGFDYFLMGFAPSVGWLFLGRAIAGVAGAVYIPANAFIADVTPPEKRAQAFGMVGSAFGLGFILGPSIGGLLGELGPRAPFFAASALAGLNFLFGLFVLPESLPPERRRAFDWKRANPLGAAVSISRHPALIGYIVAVVAYLLGNNVYPSTWAFYVGEKFGWSSLMTGVSLGASGLAMALVQGFLVGRLVRRFGEVRAAYVGLGVGAAAAVGYALVPQGWMLFLVIFLGALQAAAYPALNALMTRQIPADAQGELQGGVASVSSLAQIVGPFVMTQTFAHFASHEGPVYFPGAAFVLAGLLNLTAIGVLTVMMARERKAAAG